MKDTKGFAKYVPDLISGSIVFLIALPLSLGIAMASGVPPMAGLIAAAIGGIVVSKLGGGNVTINGPAAGLIVVVLEGVEILGHGDPMAGYRGILAAGLIAGALLMILGGLFKAGRLGDIFPASAVHGMLAAIGVIIISKQVHTLLGVVPESKKPFGLLAEVPHSFLNMNPEIAIIGAISLVILIGLPLLPMAWVKRIPAPMVVVLVGIFLGHYFDLDHQHKYLFLPEHEYELGPKFLVSLPQNFWAGFVFPDFGALMKEGFIGVVLTLTVIQGLETLLSATAVDKFDPLKRKTNLNRDLAAVGFGSMISASIGGLPMIAEIVRSRANVSNGARTSWSNFTHGVLILLFVAFAPGLIHQIPLAALAAILIVTGYRLASPSQLVHSFEIGWDQFTIFTATLVTTLATDLLIGVGTGVAVKFAFHLLRGAPLKTIFKPKVILTESGNEYRLQFHEGLMFSNFLGIKKHLDAVPANKKVVIDVTEARFIDHTVMEKIDYFIETYRESGGEAMIVGLEKLNALGHHTLSARGRADKTA